MAHLKEFADYLSSLETNSQYLQLVKSVAGAKSSIDPRNAHVTLSQTNEHQQQSVQPSQVNFASRPIVPNPPVSDPAHHQPSEQQQQQPQVKPIARNSAVSNPDPVIPYPPIARNFAVEHPYSLEAQNVRPATPEPPKPPVQVTAQFLKTALGPRIVLELLECCSNLPKKDLATIQQQVKNQLLKAQAEAKRQNKVPPNKIVIDLPPAIQAKLQATEKSDGSAAPRQPSVQEQEPIQPQVNFENAPNPPVSNPAHRQPGEQQQQPPQVNSSDPTDRDMLDMINCRAYLD